MIDERLYRETFSRLKASRQAKEEVIQMTQSRKHSPRFPKILRGAAIAAVMVMVLAATAGAVNLATDGELFRRFTVTWAGEDTLLAEDQEGNQVYISIDRDEEDLVTKEDGRLILHADRDIDITEELTETGGYHYAYEATAEGQDGSREIRTITIDVTGGPEAWTVTRSDAANAADPVTGGEDGTEKGAED